MCEDEVEELASEIREKHDDSLMYPQYKLWTRLIKNGQSKDMNNPPNHPVITGKYSKTPTPNLKMGIILLILLLVVQLLLSSLRDLLKRQLPPPIAVGISPGKKHFLVGSI